MGRLLTVKVPAKLRFSVATVKDVIVRSTGGKLKDACMSTFATTVGVGRFAVYPFSTVTASTSMFYDRGLNTKRSSEVGGNLHYNVTMKVLLVFTKRALSVLFIKGDTITILSTSTGCLEYVKFFC